MDYEKFKELIYKMSGINLTFYKEKQMKRRIDSLISKNGFDNYENYVNALKINVNLYNEFINYLTINVSEFYRNPEQWEVLERDIIPVLLTKTNTLKIWSSACSTGDEPYTLVMVLNKFLPLSNIKILATDIDKNAIEKAKTGIYTNKSVESLPKTYLDKHFTKHGELYKINEDVKKCVEYKQFNLLKDQYPTNYDLIACRNVLIYFTEEAKVDIYKNFNKALRAGGILFVGSTEQIILSSRYNFRPVKTFFYIKDELAL